MAYTIKKTDGTTLAIVRDGTANTDSTVALLGQNYDDYGVFVNQNFVRLLENGSNSIQPVNPLIGELWYNPTDESLNLWNGIRFKNIVGTGSSETPPTEAISGDLWFNPLTGQISVYNGVEFVVIGPTTPLGVEQTETVPETILDDTGTEHNITQTFIDGQLMYIASPGDTYIPDPAIVGFPTISPGLQLIDALPGGLIPKFRGTATLADEATHATSADTATTADNASSADISIETLALTDGGDPASTLEYSDVMKINDDIITTGSLTTSNLQVLNEADPILHLVGTSTTYSAHGAPQLRMLNPDNHPTQSSGANLFDTTALSNRDGSILSLEALNNGSPNTLKTIFSIGQTSGDMYYAGIGPGQGQILLTNIEVQHITNDKSVTTKEYVDLKTSGDIIPPENQQFDIGSTTKKYQNVYATSFVGKATQAAYADLAERFESDTVLTPGTVIQIGGEKEITTAQHELSELVFGVISTNPAYLMNTNAGTNETHPAVAMIGRVPVRTIGVVNKGDRLVSAGNGLARAAKLTEITMCNVIGRALEDKSTISEELVEAVIRIN